MAVYFCDSSALVKRYVQETGSAWVIGLTDKQAQNPIYIAGITAVEITAAMTRRVRGRTLTPADAAQMLTNFRYDLARQYVVIDLLPKVLTQAAGLAEAHALRGYDAVQLAAALALQAARQAAGIAALTFLSADQELNVAATQEGLTVDDPNQH